jgi:hypothetical protein
MPKPHEPPVQLTFRPEGLMRNAYLLPPPDSRDRALLIGSILLRIVHENPDRKQQFVDLMQDVMADAIKEITGKEPMYQIREGHG